jgi:hypothetical protein
MVSECEFCADDFFDECGSCGGCRDCGTCYCDDDDAYDDFYDAGENTSIEQDGYAAAQYRRNIMEKGLTHEEIAYAAFMLYLDRVEDGCTDADDELANWYAAEKKLIEREKRSCAL